MGGRGGGYPLRSASFMLEMVSISLGRILEDGIDKEILIAGALTYILQMPGRFRRKYAKKTRLSPPLFLTQGD